MKFYNILPKHMKHTVVRLHLEEGRTIKSLSVEYGVAQASIVRWVKSFRETAAQDPATKAVLDSYTDKRIFASSAMYKEEYNSDKFPFNSINSLLAIVQNAVFLHFSHALEPYGITPIQYDVLRCLWETEPQSPSLLAERLHLDTSTITGILKRMEEKDLLWRVTDKTDRRCVLVHLLPAGVELREKMGNTIELVEQRLLEDFTSDEKEILKKLLIALDKKTNNP